MRIDQIIDHEHDECVCLERNFYLQTRHFRYRCESWKFQKFKDIRKKQEGALNPPQNDLVLLLIFGVYVHLSPTITFHNL